MLEEIKGSHADAAEKIKEYFPGAKQGAGGQQPQAGLEDNSPKRDWGAKRGWGTTARSGAGPPSRETSV